MTRSGVATSVLAVASTIVWIACGAAQIAPEPGLTAEQRERAATASQAGEEHLERELDQEAPDSAQSTPGEGRDFVTDRADAAAAQLDDELPTPPDVPSVSTPQPDPELTPTPVEVEPPPPAPEPFTEAKWVETSGAAYLQTRSAEEAEYLARRNALENAVRIAAGEKIDVTTTMIVAEDNKQFRDAFIQFSEVSVQGYVTQYEILDWELNEFRHEDRTRAPIPGYVVHVRAYVVPPKGERDEAFWIRANISNVTLREGDEVVFTVNSSQNAYLTMLNIQSKGEVSVVVPYLPYVEELSIASGASMEFPSTELRESGFHLRARVPEGMDAVAESFIIVATREKVPLPQPEDGDQLQLTDLNRWLANMPQDRRAQDVVGFDIHRN
jgi:hypothetical protein